jgi:DNA modification methylase
MELNISNEDNMLLMSRYPDNYFDLAICDPPYGINIQKIKTIGTCCYDVGGNLDVNRNDYKNWDHILINDKLKFTGINYPVKPNMNRLLSDHLPILGHIEFRVEGAGSGAGSRGGYYEKYLKYKKKYLALKRLDTAK